jgi:hypothetical protein
MPRSERRPNDLANASSGLGALGLVTKQFPDILLWGLGAHPDSFQLFRPEDFVHYENNAFAGMDKLDVVARHGLSCHACNEA